MIGLDFDGVVANYRNHTTEVRFNPHLPDMLPEDALVVIVSNQGGVNFGRQNPKYPTPEIVAKRFATGVSFLREHGIHVAGIHVSVFHPRATASQIAASSQRLRRAFGRQTALLGTPWHIHASERARKPSPLMLQRAGIAVYYGDSPEDAEAAKAAGARFVPVPRFE